MAEFMLLFLLGITIILMAVCTAGAVYAFIRMIQQDCNDRKK